jgi:hypothetical protein
MKTTDTPIGNLGMTFQSIMLAALILAWAAVASGYPVGRALSLEKVTGEADIIFKGTAVASGPVLDEWFKPCQNFVALETRFTVISVIKGNLPDTALRFRHYDESPLPQARMFEPQYYHFEAGRTYLVFAKQGGPAGVFRQLWENHKAKGDQGVLWCPDDQPLTANTVEWAVWNELMLMLKSSDAANVIYAIRQLDQMSGRRDNFGDTQDFERADVLKAIHGLMTNVDAKIAQAAITAVGSHNPYLSDERTIHWLATVGSAEVPGIGKMDPKMRNIGGELYWQDLAALADSNADSGTRSMAILALGLVR